MELSLFDEKSINQRILSDESYNIIGACMAVHRELGSGFLEAIYQEALEHEFLLRQLEHEREKRLEVKYKDKVLEKKYIADFVCYGEIIVELKAVNSLESVHEAQLINYLKATNMQIGLLVNFGQPSLQQKRVINKNYKKLL